MRTPERGEEETAAVLGSVNATHGSHYRLVEALTGGFQSGAWLLRDDGGRRAVLKWTRDQVWAEQIQRAARAVALARRHGYPTPAWLAVGTTGDGVGYQVQEHVTGQRRERLTVDTARRAVEILEVAAGLDPDPERSWSHYVDAAFRDWSSTYDRVAATGPAGAELAESAARLIGRYPYPAFPTADLVHGDFRLGNILFAEDAVRGVVDIEAIGSGTRAFDYATLLDHEPADDTAVELLVAAGAEVAGSAVLAYCVAHVFCDLALFMHQRRAALAEPYDLRLASLRTRIETVSAALAG